jgi:hypothetical protein
MARRRGDLLPLLIEMARRPGPGLKDLMVKRYHYALRWLRRYRRVRASERG